MKNNSNMLDSEVVIVGAGVSGLITAHKLLKKVPSMKITMLEETNIIGGQVYATQSMGSLGAKFTSRNNYHMMDLLEELDLELYPKEVEKKLKRKSTLSEGLFSSLINFEVNAFLREVDIRCKDYKSHFENENRKECAIKKNEPTMETYLKKRLLFSKSQQFARFLIRLTCGVESTEVSITEFMSTCFSCNGLTPIVNTYMNDSEDNYEFDTHAFLEQLQERIKDVSIYTGCKITQIIQASDSYVLNDNRGNNFKAKVVVLSIPWNDVMDIYFYPDLPKELKIQRFPSRYLMTSFLLQYEKAHWRQNNFSGSMYCDGEFPMVCYEVEDLIIYGFVLHNEDNLNSVDRHLICGTLSRMFGTEMANPAAFSMRSFVQASILNTPQVTAYGQLVWGSSCTATVYRGLLDGAVQGGLRAALNVLSILHPQTVNYEDYKEVQRADAIYDKPGTLTKLTCFVNIKNTSYVILGILCVGAALHLYSVMKMEDSALVVKQSA